MLCIPLEKVPVFISLLIIRSRPRLHSTLFSKRSTPHFKVIFCPTSVMTEFAVAKSAPSTEERTKHTLIRPQNFSYARNISDSQCEVIWHEHDTNHIRFLLILHSFKDFNLKGIKQWSFKILLLEINLPNPKQIIVFIINVGSENKKNTNRFLAQLNLKSTNAVHSACEHPS